MIDIVLCVDGTNSQSYRNSSVKNFHDRVKADHKYYYPGPKEYHGLTGGDWVGIQNAVAKDLNGLAAEYGIDSFFNGYKCTMGRNSKFRFIMIGHSRGGHIIIYLAAMLRFRTHFMGLYDAVERTSTRWDDSKVIYNADNIYHARRDSAIGSRSYFGNTGLSSGDGGRYVERSFRTSHGGVGGDVIVSVDTVTAVAEFSPFGLAVEEATNTSIVFTDTSCAITPLHQSQEQMNKATLCLSESFAADTFITTNAAKLGVRI